jgi:hypothetical protein
MEREGCAADGLAGGGGEQDFAAVGVAADAGSEVNGNAEDIAVGLKDIAVMDAAADLEGALGRVEFFDATLGGHGVGDGAFDRIEFEKETIAKAADEPAACHGRRVADGGGEELEEAVGLNVAKLAGDPERSGYVDEKKGTRCGGKSIGTG